MGKRKTEAEKADTKSIYEKIPRWVEENKGYINRKKKIDKDGNEVEKKASLFPCIKAVLFNQSKLKKHPYDELCDCVKYLVEDVMEITPATFYNAYNIEFMKEYKMYSGIMHLIDESPEDVQKECCFNHKDIVFRSVWPQFYEKNLAGAITPHDILFATNEKKDGFKTCIVRAGQVKTITSKDKGTKYGAVVDEILFDAIKEELFAVTKMCATIPDAFYVLGEYSKKEEQNGGNDIAMSRGYKSILDFFYLNLPEDFQVKYGLDYLDAREKVGLDREPVLEIAIRTRCGDIDGLRKFAFLGGDDEVMPEEYCEL